MYFDCGAPLQIPLKNKKAPLIYLDAFVNPGTARHWAARYLSDLINNKTL